MKITLLARTILVGDMPDELADGGYVWQGLDVTDADELAEIAGRGCYLSWKRPNPKTRENVDYLKHILDVKHESVLAHATATFYVSGVSRALTHELVRSRFLVFSQESQRYVDSSTADIILPPAIKPGSPQAIEFVEANYAASKAYENIVSQMLDEGVPRKKAREAARGVLPNATATSLTLSGNHRAFRDFIKQRFHVAADAEIQEFAGLLLKELRLIAPSTYQDIPEEPYGYE
jgi:thymidylate synthase (FAD)